MGRGLVCLGEKGELRLNGIGRDYSDFDLGAGNKNAFVSAEGVGGEERKEQVGQ